MCCWCDGVGASQAVAQRVVGVKCQKQVAVASVGFAVQRKGLVRTRVVYSKHLDDVSCNKASLASN